jgi:sulfur carrier protein ThiS
VNGLNPPQRNAVATTLRQLEQAINSIENLLDSRNIHGATYITEVNIDPVTAQEMWQKCEEVRDQIAEIVFFFELPRQHWYDRRIIVAEMTTAWINLEETSPSRLRRYGVVDSTLTETLTPRLDHLAQLVRDIQALVNRRK